MDNDNNNRELEKTKGSVNEHEHARDRGSCKVLVSVPKREQGECQRRNSNVLGVTERKSDEAACSVVLNHQESAKKRGQRTRTEQVSGPDEWDEKVALTRNVDDVIMVSPRYGETRTRRFGQYDFAK